MSRTESPSLLLVNVMAVTMAASSLWAAMYECTDSIGARVFTDSRAQLSHCVPLVAGSAHAAGGNMAPVEGVPSEGTPSPGTPSFPDREREAPSVPHDPIGQAATDPTPVQRCASGLNPFNPFMTQPCPPQPPVSAGDPQASPERPPPGTDP